MTILDRFRLDDRVAVVTGAGRGIAQAIAIGFAEAGAHVVVNSLTRQECEETAEQVRARGRMALIVDGDVRDLSDFIASSTVDSFGRLDVWVNSVGGADDRHVKAVVDTADGWFRAQLELNLTTAFQGCRAAGHRMTDGGSIINIASGAGMRGSPLTGGYAAAKAGLINLTQTVALELADRGIRVNAISPGPIDTRLFRYVTDSDDEDLAEIARSIPLGRLGDPTDIAAAALYLASPAAAWVTGENLLVSGGRTHRVIPYRETLD